jgi:hypothetical protein
MRTLLLALLFLSTNALAEPKYLTYTLGAAHIVISNVPCVYTSIKDEFPYAVAAFKEDGNKISGCFKKESEELIKIQWRNGDFSVLPANAFLLAPVPAKNIQAPTL